MKILPFTFLLFPVLLAAQSDSTRLDTLRAVIITATRLPSTTQTTALSVSMLDGNYVRQAQPRLSLQESLAAAPGVFMLNDANFAQDLRIAVRGFGARAGFGIRGIKLLLDGIPESAPDGQAQVDNLDLATVGRIEVLRGASGGLYGNASGGVISLSSEPIPEKTIASAHATVGTFGFHQLHAQGGSYFGKTGFRVALTRLELEGYRAHAAFQSTIANGQWAWQPDTSAQLKIMLNYVHSPQADDPGALSITEVRNNRRAAHPNNLRFAAGEVVQQGRAGLIFEKKWTHGRRLRLRSYTTWRDFENRLPFQNGGQVTIQRWFAGMGGQYEWAHKNWRWSTGLDLDRQSDQRQRFDNLGGSRGDQSLNQQEIFTSAGAYTLMEWMFKPRWTFSGGFRLDLVRLAVDDYFESDGLQSGQSTYRRGSPWAGVLFLLHPGLRVYANVTTNFETPTLNEISNKPDNSGGFNDDLEPQRSFSLETGLRGQWPMGMRWELALYRIVTRDELAPYELPGFPGRTFYRNAGETLRQGLELALRWEPLRGLELGITGSLTDFKFKKYETSSGNFAGKNLPGLPRHWGMTELRYQHQRGVFGRAQLRYTGSFFADDANAVQTEAYVLVNLRLGYARSFRFGRLEFFTGSDNVFGAEYFNNIRLNAAAGRYYEPGAGAVVFGGLEWRWE